MKHERQTTRDREVIYGVNPVMEALKAGRRRFYSVTVKPGHKKSGPVGEIVTLAESKRIAVDYQPVDEIAKRERIEGHQGVLANVSPPVYVNLDDLADPSSAPQTYLLAALDGVMDPRNLGAIIRSAEVFGASGVIFPYDRACSYTPVAAKASAGAGERMKLCRVVNMAETIRRLADDGFTCVALEEDAEADFDSAPDGPLVLVLGGEGTGVRELVKKRCGNTAKIPMKGGVGSLNVSTAAAIAFYIASNRG